MRLVLCNCAPEQAKALAHTVVQEGLAACVNIVGPVTSVYRWEGAVCEDTESTLWMKTAAETVEALSERIRALHSYDVPEILVLDVDQAASDPRYMAWVRKTTSLEDRP